MRTRTRTRIVETIAAAALVAAFVTPFAMAKPTKGKRIQVPASLKRLQEPGSTGYLPPTIRYREPGSTGYLPPMIRYREPGSTGYLPPTINFREP
jgi:hypothetical protein